MPETDSIPYNHDLTAEDARRLPDWGGDDVFATAPRRKQAPVEVPVGVAAAYAEEFDAPLADALPEAPPEPVRERRTIVITGRPFDNPRRRPVRTVDERIASNPERIAAWAFCLGLGLVIAAIATAGL